MEGQERQCPDHEDGITGIKHDDPKDTGALMPTCQAVCIGDTRSEEVNSPSMQGQERFEIEEEYESNWCEAWVDLDLISSGYATVLKCYCQSGVLRKMLPGDERGFVALRRVGVQYILC